MTQGSHLSAALPTTRCHYYDKIVELRILYYYESTTIPCQLLPNVHTRTFRQNTCLHAAQLNTSHPPPIPGILYTTTWRRTPVVAAATNIVEAAHVPPEVSGATLVVFAALAGGAAVVFAALAGGAAVVFAALAGGAAVVFGGGHFPPGHIIDGGAEPNLIFMSLNAGLLAKAAPKLPSSRAAASFSNTS